MVRRLSRLRQRHVRVRVRVEAVPRPGAARHRDEGFADLYYKMADNAAGGGFLGLGCRNCRGAGQRGPAMV